MVKTHWLRHTKIYRSWDSMKQRCTNESCNQYYNYWGRGISMCESWKNSFDNFYKDMWNTYMPWLTIDRIDNNKWYYKENCRWVTKAEQARNRRFNIYYEENWERKTIAEWCTLKWIEAKTVYNRIHLWYSVKDAIYKKKSDKRHSKYNPIHNKLQ